MSGNVSYRVGAAPELWNGGISQSLTFIVTEDCNLRCKYCYITHKSANKSMSLDVAKKFIDYILLEQFNKPESVVLDFIGGEPTLEIDLIDNICDYFKIKCYEYNDNWYWNYRISICTNGINYNSHKVQNFIKKNYNKLEMSITIDGTKIKHDLQRVFPDGTGSYEEVRKSVDLLKQQFVPSTKVTFASDDLIYLKDSILELWKIGIVDVAANVVFEDVWKEGDDQIFEEQLKLLADEIIDKKYFTKYSCTLFDDAIGAPYTKEQLSQSSCGAGKMLALGPDGNIYPCMRYKDYSLNKKKEYILGNVEDGIDFDRIRPFILATISTQSDRECLECKVAMGCSFCQGFNYDEADTPTNFQRAKYICKMHKARVRANNYYFAKLYNIYGIEKQNLRSEKNRLNFVLTDNPVECCFGSTANRKGNNIMDLEIVVDGLKYAEHNFMFPVFIHDKDKWILKEIPEFTSHKIFHIVPAKFQSDIRKITKNYIIAYDDCDDVLNYDYEDNCIVNVDINRIHILYERLRTIFERVNRINLNLIGYSKETDFSIYERELEKISDYIYEQIKTFGVIKELNVLTDIFFLREHECCDAGTDCITLAPDGKFYICPEFYFDEEESEIGDLEEGVVNHKNPHLFSLDYAPLCKDCNANHCSMCSYKNKKNTLEVNVPAEFQCIKSHIEMKVSQKLQNKLDKILAMENKIKEVKYLDPILEFKDNNFLGRMGVSKKEMGKVYHG